MYQTTYKEGVEAGTATLEGAKVFNTFDGGNTSRSLNSTELTLPMRVSPVYNVFGLGGTPGTVSNQRIVDVANEKTVTGGAVIVEPTEKGFSSDFDLSPAAPTGINGTRSFHYTADSAL